MFLGIAGCMKPRNAVRVPGGADLLGVQPGVRHGNGHDLFMLQKKLG